ncbi:pyridine nucleotide-disulfide oxidoreductase [Pseudomonas nicosulfuronedens]|uniref:Pyridine nucleotide-disulfide oxidoreductase n=1 Tax=Pseudomonas nicosulfuronedens TaxID=2571105 RepID=A0A5R9QNN5_9PSED|nr:MULTISPECIES: FAD-dependent oxidoreductase [Pseudomonas]TLX71309.1 pyridine nucleotide-disulfide oxidoreductase [Pseudomonas nicosulfuronedens]
MTETASLTAIIVGAGHAAGELATSLRDNGWEGRILLIGEEPQLPYHRPPLSKAYLSGAATSESLLIKPRATYEKANVEIISGVRVDRIDRETATVHLADGRTAQYDRLILATGGRPRPLPIPQIEQAERSGNFHYLRTLQDVDRIRRQFEPGMRLVIVGGGYIGLEVAAVAIKRGLKVTVLEALPRVLARVTAPELSAFYESRHRAAGVEIRTDTQVRDVQLDPSGDAVAALQCADGSSVPADLVVVGIGLLPNVELAVDAGLEVDNGILVDEFGQTSDSNIYAAGDCSNHPNPLLGRRLRLESVPNALEQARSVAASICGKPKAYASIPWFWSDQYELKLKMVGLSQGYDQLVIRGTPESDSFSAFYLKDGSILAADTVNRPPEFMLAKRFIAEKVRVDPARLADDSQPLKDLLPSA